MHAREKERERDSMRKLAYYFTITIISYQLLVGIVMLMMFYQFTLLKFAKFNLIINA